MKLKHIDHIVLTVNSIDATCRFYSSVLGMKKETYGHEQHKTLVFENHRIKLQQQGTELAPHARKPTPGAMDMCLITDMEIDEVVTHVKLYGVQIEKGPIARTGGHGELVSIYIRDPDGNLLEIANYA